VGVQQVHGQCPIDLRRSRRLGIAVQHRLLVPEPLVELLYLFGRVGREKVLAGYVGRLLRVPLIPQLLAG
jgi:hypothetical protein